MLDGIRGNGGVFMGMNGKGLEQREGRDFEELHGSWLASLKIMS